jgi:hypothetical protein
MTEVMDRVAELDGVIEAKSLEIDNLVTNEVKITDGNMEIPEGVYTQMKTLMEEQKQAEEIKAALQFGVSHAEYKARQKEMEEKGFGDGSSAAMAAAAGLSLGSQQLGMQLKTLGEMFVQSEEFKSFKATGRMTMDTPFELDLQDVPGMGTFDKKDIYNALGNHTITHGFGSIQFDPLVPRGQRAARVRDLFPVATTNANLIDYFRVLGFAEGSGDGNAGPVRDRAAADGTSAPAGNSTDTFGLKPKSNLTFQSAQAPVRTIAHWEAAHRNILADEPQMQSTINNELLYGLALEEDYQILNGDGTNENLLGLLNTPNVQTYTQVADADGAGPGTAPEPKSDALRRSATKAIIANYAPSGYVLHPYDWEDVELQKDSQGRYMLITNVTVGAESRIWRQPVVETPAMPEGKWVTGAWGIGAQLYDRQQANVRVAEQHADFFVRNAIAILVEERLAFAVKRPESFVIGTFVS